VNTEEDKVREFYDRYGWSRDAAGAFGEDRLFRDFSPPYYRYHESVNARTLACFSGLDGRLLMAGGGDLPETHVAIAEQFAHTTCLDISRVAIEIARDKLAGRGEFVVGSILEIPAPDDDFDAVYCAHVIFHIDRDLQATAVRELIRVTKPGGRIVVIYSNRDSLPARMVAAKNRMPVLWRLTRKMPPARPGAENRPPLYFFAHPLTWWGRFLDVCDLEMRPWDVMGNTQEQALFINDRVARVGYRVCSWFENTYPGAAARWWSYPLIVLTKRPHALPSH
jgi:SAM-dependent methyltransferase